MVRMNQCDMRRPICLQCEKSRRHCPGPDSRFKFLDERPRLESQNASQSDSLSLCSGKPAQADPMQVRQRGRSGRTLSHRGAGFFSIRSARHKEGRLFQTLEFVSSDLFGLQSPPDSQKDLLLHDGLSFSPSEKLSLSLIESLEYTDRIGHKLQEICPYLSEVPSRIGSNDALDKAVVSILAAHAALIRGRLSVVPAESQRYIDALRSLQHHIADPVTSKSPETLCAALILSAYEVSSWCLHIFGDSAAFCALDVN